MEIKCPNCFEIFVPNKKEEQKISNAIKKDQKFFITECIKCYQDIEINPCDLLNINTPNEEKIIYCPICNDEIGVVCYVKDETEEFYGCGECGNIWKSKSEIENLIKNGLKKYKKK